MTVTEQLERRCSHRNCKKVRREGLLKRGHQAQLWSGPVRGLPERDPGGWRADHHHQGSAQRRMTDKDDSDRAAERVLKDRSSDLQSLRIEQHYRLGNSIAEEFRRLAARTPHYVHDNPDTCRHVYDDDGVCGFCGHKRNCEHEWAEVIPEGATIGPGGVQQCKSCSAMLVSVNCQRR